MNSNLERQAVSSDLLRSVGHPKHHQEPARHGSDTPAKAALTVQSNVWLRD